MILVNNSITRGRFVACTRTDKTSHFLKTPSAITTAGYPIHVVHEYKGVYLKPVCRDREIGLGTERLRDGGGEQS